MLAWLCRLNDAEADPVPSPMASCHASFHDCRHQHCHLLALVMPVAHLPGHDSLVLLPYTLYCTSSKGAKVNTKFPDYNACCCASSAGGMLVNAFSHATARRVSDADALHLVSTDVLAHVSAWAGSQLALSCALQCWVTYC